MEDNCEEPSYCVTVQANGTAIVPLTGSTVTSTATASACSNISYEDAWFKAYAVAEQNATIVANNDANIIEQTLEIITSDPQLINNPNIITDSAPDYNTALGVGALGAPIVFTLATDNTAVGYNALYSNKTDQGHTAVGYGALQNTSGVVRDISPDVGIYANTGIGYQALQSTTTGDSNIAVGDSALQANTTGYNNIAIGAGALQSNTTGIQNNAMGNTALYSNTTGIQNNAMGNTALYSNTTGNYNTAVGDSALFSNTIGNRNSAIGNDALNKNTTGIQNNAMGNTALYSNTTGSFNTAVGDGALYSNTTGSNLTAIGNDTLTLNTTGGSNSALGDSALQNNTTGTQNTAVGTNALFLNITGSDLTAIGYNADIDLSGNTYTNSTAIGNGATIRGDNTIYLGNTSVTSLQCQVTSITGYSDIKLKTNLKKLDAGLDFINELNPVRFDWINRKENKEDIGFIAQDLLKAQESTGITIPKLVDTSDPDYLMAAYGTLIPVLVKAIQDLKKDIDDKQNTTDKIIQELKQEIIDLKKK